MQIEAIFPFLDLSAGTPRRNSKGFSGFPRRPILNTRSFAYPESRRHGLLERPIIKVMATFQVDFRVARSERPPPGRPITVTKGPAILLSDPFLSSLYLLCTPNGNRFLSSNSSVHPPSPSIIVYTHR